MDSVKYLQELSKCVKCGSCKASCPTYGEDSTETMVARGRLALLWALSAGRIQPSPALNERIFSCTLCGACTGHCPPGVDIKEVMYHGRHLLKKTDRKRRHVRFFTHFWTRQPKLSFRLLHMSQHFLLPYLHRKGFLPFTPELPERQLKDSSHVFTVAKKKGRVAVFTGCAVNFLYPSLGESLINVLHNTGYEVILPAGEVCCGAPLRTLGLEEQARGLAEKNTSIFNKLNIDAVLSLCPSCTQSLKIDYPKIIGQGVEKAMDISAFFMDALDFARLDPPYTRAIYHDPCHLKYGLGLLKEPRKVMTGMGTDLLPADGDRCCGFAGVFCLTNREISQGLLLKCASDYVAADADAIVTSCPGCIIQLSKEVRNKPVVHLIEVLEEALMPHT